MRYLAILRRWGGTGRRTPRRASKRFRRLTVPEPLEDRALPGGSLLELLLGAPLLSPFLDSSLADGGDSPSDDVADAEALARKRTAAFHDLVANPAALEQTVAEVRNLVQIASAEAQAADAQEDALPGSEGAGIGASAGDFPALEPWWDDPGWLAELEAVLRELARAGSRFEFDSLGGPVLEQPGGLEVPPSELGDPLFAGDLPGELPVEGDPGGGGGMATLDYGGGGYGGGGYGENEPPVAGNDQAYSGIDGGVTIFVLGNDYDPDDDDFAVTGVSQPGHGSAAVGYGGGSVVYTPDPGYTSGNDTFQYTVTDEHGASSQAVVTVSRVEITGFSLERQLDDGSWTGVPDAEDSWSHDTLKWIAQYAPSETPGLSMATWWKKEWSAPDLPGNWSEFAGRVGQPVQGNPLMGDWAIRPELCFTPPGQTPFWVDLATPKHRVDAQITSIEWTPHQANPSLAAEIVSDDRGVAMYPDAAAPGQAARNLVDVVVQLAPAKAGLSVTLQCYDVDDWTDDDGPIDTDPNPAVTHVNNQDNLGGWQVAFTAPQTDANGQIRSVVSLGPIQPGNNFRMAALPRSEVLAKVKPLAREEHSMLFYDTDGDGFYDFNDGEPALYEWLSVRGIRVTPTLTIWRKLRVEVDSMGVPPETVTFPDDGKPVDVHPGDVPAPDTELLQGAFQPAFVQPVFGTPYDDDTSDFVYHVTSTAAATRGIGESTAYWAAYVMGAYEGSAAEDVDPNNEEICTFSQNYDTEPEYAFIYHETLRDGHNDGGFPEWAGVYSEEHHERQNVVHEIGHQFELWVGHPGNNPPTSYSVMGIPPGPSRPDSFAEYERFIIRTTISV